MCAPCISHMIDQYGNCHISATFKPYGDAICYQCGNHPSVEPIWDPYVSHMVYQYVNCHISPIYKPYRHTICQPRGKHPYIVPTWAPSVFDMVLSIWGLEITFERKELAKRFQRLPPIISTMPDLDMTRSNTRNSKCQPRNRK